MATRSELANQFVLTDLAEFPGFIPEKHIDPSILAMLTRSVGEMNDEQRIGVLPVLEVLIRPDVFRFSHSNFRKVMNYEDEDGNRQTRRKIKNLASYFNPEEYGSRAPYFLDMGTGFAMGLVLARTSAENGWDMVEQFRDFALGAEAPAQLSQWREAMTLQMGRQGLNALLRAETLLMKDQQPAGYFQDLETAFRAITGLDEGPENGGSARPKEPVPTM